MKSETTQSSILTTLTKMSDDLLAEEGITKEILDYIDLDIECSPVICVRGEQLRDAVKVQESQDPDKFLLTHWKHPEGWVARGSLKIMRARYLLALKGPPNPEPIITFKTDTAEGKDAARKLLAAFGGNEFANALLK